MVAVNGASPSVITRQWCFEGGNFLRWWRWCMQGDTSVSGLVVRISRSKAGDEWYRWWCSIVYSRSGCCIVYSGWRCYCIVHSRWRWWSSIVYSGWWWCSVMHSGCRIVHRSWWCSCSKTTVGCSGGGYRWTQSVLDDGCRSGIFDERVWCRCWCCIGHNWWWWWCTVDCLHCNGSWSDGWSMKEAG